MHSHDHSHAQHGSGEAGNRIGTAFFLNLMFTVIEFVGGILTNSTAILADAVHDLGDTLSLGMAWGLQRLGSRPASNRFTYGYQRLSLLGALVNATILVIGSLWVLSEAIPRLSDPVMPHALGMTWLAILGIAVNGAAAWKLSGGKTLNERVLNWHLIEDVLGWVTVLAVSIVLQFADWPILDPLLSIGFTLFILLNVLRHLRTTVRLFLQGTPDEALAESIQARLTRIPHVTEVHHLHLWSLVGHAHLVLDTPITSTTHQRVKESIRSACEGCNIARTTIEFEQQDEICRDSGPHHRSQTT